MTDKTQEALDAVEEHGSQRKAAKALGIARSTLQARLAKHPGMVAAASEMGFPADKVADYWVKGEGGSYRVKCDVAEYSWLDEREAFIEAAKKHAPKYKKTRYPKQADNLLVVDVADAHFGKLAVTSETGQDYNLRIARDRLVEGTKTLLQKAKSHGIEHVAFVMGNDILHIDTPHRTTTSGTKQDTDGQWHEAYTMAKSAYVEAIEACLEVAPTSLVHCPSNHDYMSGWMLTDSVCSWFHKNPNVKTVLNSIAHRKYMQWGQNLIGFTHGDGAKEKDLPSLMQYEARKEWGQSSYGYWVTHHTHHKNKRVADKLIEKDHIGVTVLKTGLGLDPTMTTPIEVVRSPSAPDGWHHRNAYMNRQAVEAFLFSAQHGKHASFTHWF